MCTCKWLHNIYNVHVLMLKYVKYQETFTHDTVCANCHPHVHVVLLFTKLFTNSFRTGYHNFAKDKKIAKCVSSFVVFDLFTQIFIPGCYTYIYLMTYPRADSKMIGILPICLCDRDYFMNYWLNSRNFLHSRKQAS